MGERWYWLWWLDSRVLNNRWLVGRTLTTGSYVAIPGTRQKEIEAAESLDVSRQQSAFSLCCFI